MVNQKSWLTLKKFWWKLELQKIKEIVDCSSWMYMTGELHPADISTSVYKPKVLPQLCVYGPEFVQLLHEK